MESRDCEKNRVEVTSWAVIEKSEGASENMTGSKSMNLFGQYAGEKIETFSWEYAERVSPGEAAKVLAEATNWIEVNDREGVRSVLQEYLNQQSLGSDPRKLVEYILQDEELLARIDIVTDNSYRSFCVELYRDVAYAATIDAEGKTKAYSGLDSVVKVLTEFMEKGSRLGIALNYVYFGE